MKRTLVKAILKTMATTAMVATIFISTGKEAKAITVEEFAAKKGVDPSDVFVNDALFVEYCTLDFAEIGVSFESVEAKAAELLAHPTANAAAMVAPAHKDMLALVNADRAAYGAGKLVWNANLEVIAQQRAMEVMNNTKSAAYAKALAANDYNTQSALIHSGARVGTTENAIVSWNIKVNSATANANWIASAGHHEVRITAGYTQYAAASYTDPITGQEVWIEVFGNGAPLANNSAFDYMRYAKEYPDLAAAFGQNRDALYNHYITFGVTEGRKAYYTDGTAIGM